MISIITPVYNCDTYIDECLDSVLAQTFKDFEIICVDDGSTDNSLAILQKYAAKDGRVKIISQTNKGVCSARNAALTISRGNYIFPLDADDKIAPDCLEKLHKIIVSSGASVVYCDGKYFGEVEIDIRCKPVSKQNMYRINYVHNSALCDAELVRKYGGWDERLNRLGYEDYDLWLTFLDDGKEFSFLPEKLFFYRLKPHRLSRNRIALSSLSIQKEIEKFLRKKHPKRRFYDWRYKILKFIYQNHVTSHNYRLIKILKIPVYRKKIKTI